MKPLRSPGPPIARRHARASPGALLGLLLLGLALGAAVAPGPAAALDGETPPPVSGRRLSLPESILPADVLARVELLRANTELLRRYMGKPTAPPPLLRVVEARPREVYSQALNLQLRANRLAFEQVRVVRSDAMPLTGEARPADVFAVVDSALAAVLLVKHELGIEEVVAEEPRPEGTTPSEVFNATIRAGTEVDQLLDRMVSASDVFQTVTGAVHTAATLHALIPGGPNMPDEPPFEPNRMPADVFFRLQRCFELITRISEARQVHVLSLSTVGIESARISPNDASDLAALVAEELAEIHRNTPGARTPTQAYYPGRRFPAHVYQRAGLLELILEDLAASIAAPADAPAPGED